MDAIVSEPHDIDTVVFSTYPELERRCCRVANLIGYEPLIAPGHQLGLILGRRKNALGLLWDRRADVAAETIRGYRHSSITNPIIVLLNQTGSLSACASQRADILMAGADDVQPVDIDIEELGARIKAIAARGYYIDHQRIKFAEGCVYEHNHMTISGGAKTVRLAKREAQILEHLARYPNATRTKQNIMDALYGGEDEPEIKIVDVLICKLRARIHEATGGKDVIQTVWGRGYCFVPEGFVPKYNSTRARVAR